MMPRAHGERQALLQQQAQQHQQALAHAQAKLQWQAAQQQQVFLQQQAQLQHRAQLLQLQYATLAMGGAGGMQFTPFSMSGAYGAGLPPMQMAAGFGGMPGLGSMGIQAMHITAAAMGPVQSSPATSTASHGVLSQQSQGAAAHACPAEPQAQKPGAAPVEGPVRTPTYPPPSQPQPHMPRPPASTHPDELLTAGRRPLPHDAWPLQLDAQSQLQLEADAEVESVLQPQAEQQPQLQPRLQPQLQQFPSPPPCPHPNIPPPPPHTLQAYKALLSVDRSQLRPGAVLTVGHNITLIACAVCQPSKQGPFARLFFGRRVNGAGHTAAMSPVRLPNDVGSMTIEDTAYNYTSLEAFVAHFVTEHPTGKYEVSQRGIQ